MALRDLSTPLPDLDQVLAQEAEPFPLPGNAPLPLASPFSVWFVETGTADVFAVPRGASGPRTHLCTVAAGQVLCGLDPGSGTSGLALLAVGHPGTKLRRLDTARLQHLARDPNLAQDLAARLDGWLVRFSGEIFCGAAPKVFQELQAGAELAIQEGDRAARPREGAVWVRLLAGNAFLGGDPDLVLETDDLCPVPEGLWLTFAGEARLATSVTAALLADAADNEAWDGLARFHGLCLQHVAAELAEGERRERERLESKAALDRSTLRGSYARLASVLEPLSAATAGLESTSDPLLAACRMVGQVQGITIRSRPESQAGVKQGESLIQICAASRIRTRRVILRDSWWRRDNGPLVAFRTLGTEQKQKRPVALLPTSPRSYELVDPAEGTRQPVDAALAESLSGDAFMFYPPLPERPLTRGDLLRHALADQRKELMTILLMGGAGGLLALLIPILTGQVFGSIIPNANRPQLLQITLALVVSALAGAVFQVTRSIAVLRLGGKIDGALQGAVWDRLLSLPVTFFKRFTVGDLANRSMGIDTIRDLLTGNVLTSILAAVFSVFSFVLLFYYSWRLALAATALVVVLSGITALLLWLQLRHQRELLRLQGKIASLLFALIHGIAKLRVAGAEARAYARWAAAFAEQRRRALAAQRVANVQASVNAVYSVVAALAIFAVVGLSTQESLSIGEFLAFNAAFGQFLSASLSMVSVISSVLLMVPVYERLEPILQTVPEVDDSKAEPGELTGEIEFSHVSFRYHDDGPLILDDVSFRAGAGEFIALVGPSGAGKSTCLRLILGFENPISGSIYFDGQDLASLAVQSVRRQIGVVLQHGKPMSGSIFSNIVGSAQLTLDDAWEAARMAGLEEDIKAMPMGMHTVVSEGAETFSGGQKQRLLIARAIVHRPRIILFDEATSALDNRTQEVVSRSLEGLKATRIVIAHRLSTILNADRIYVFEAGRIVEEGTYQDLARRGGPFARLVERQVL
jgi:ATP-binding cassette subfamily C protein